MHHLSYPASRDGACGADSFFSLCTELLKRSSFLFFPAEEKKRSKEKKAPTEINLPEFRDGRMLSRKCFRRKCRYLFGHISLRTTYGCETQKIALRLASLQGLATGKFCTAGFIYRYSALDVTVSVYLHTQDTAPTRALLVDVTC